MVLLIGAYFEIPCQDLAEKELGGGFLKKIVIRLLVVQME